MGTFHARNVVIVISKQLFIHHSAKGKVCMCRWGELGFKQLKQVGPQAGKIPSLRSDYKGVLVVAGGRIEFSL